MLVPGLTGAAVFNFSERGLPIAGRHPNGSVFLARLQDPGGNRGGGGDGTGWGSLGGASCLRFTGVFDFMFMFLHIRVEKI